jgi:hypothetical protein
MVYALTRILQKGFHGVFILHEHSTVPSTFFYGGGGGRGGAGGNEVGVEKSDAC